MVLFCLFSRYDQDINGLKFLQFQSNIDKIRKILMTYQNILVPIDGSETSLSVIPDVIEFAKAFNSNIIVAEVMTLDPYIAAEYLSGHQSNMLIERARKFIEDNLNTAKQKFEAAGIQVSTELLEGENISKTIATAVEKLNIDLVILSSHGRSGFQKFILGSVAQKLITDLKIPVMVIKQDQNKTA